MKSFEEEIRTYERLNELASEGGTVIFGGTEDKDIPICELKQSFSLDTNLYNRSVSGLSVETASEIYDDCVAVLRPQTLLLHIGEADTALFEKSPESFDRGCRALIAGVKAVDDSCKIILVSMRNPENLPLYSEINRHLRNIAEAERIGFADISVARAWNPNATRETVSFLHSIGFVRPLRTAWQDDDLIKILFYYDRSETVKATAASAERSTRREKGRAGE